MRRAYAGEKGIEMTNIQANGVRVSVFYAPSEGERFDFDYYVEQHVPMVFRLLQPHGCRGMSVDRGLSGGRPGSAAPYAVTGHMEFGSIEEFQAAMGAEGAQVQGDVPNYTDTKPTMQISEIVSVQPQA